MSGNDANDERDRKLQEAIEDQELDEQKLYDESAAQYGVRILEEGIRHAADAMVQLCIYCEDDKLRFAAAKYVLDRGFGSTSPNNGKYAEREDDVLAKFFEKISDKTIQELEG